MNQHYLLTIVSVGLSSIDIQNTFRSLPSSLPVWIQYIIVAPKDVVHCLQLDPLLVHCDFVVDNHLGVYNAMNLGLDASQGSYLWFLNSGDLWNFTSFDHLFVLLSNSYKNNITFIFGKPVIHKLFFLTPVVTCSLSSLFLISFMLFQVMPICHQNIIISRKSHPYFNTKYFYSADFDLLISSLKAQSTSYFLPVNISLALPGGISDTHRLKVFLERLDSSFHNFSIALFPFVLISFIIRIFYLALSNIIKSFLLFFH